MQTADRQRVGVSVRVMLRVMVRVSVRVKIKVRVGSSILPYCRSAGLTKHHLKYRVDRIFSASTAAKIIRMC